MRAGLIIILIISAALISATTVYARENTTNSAIAVMKDAKGNTVGLATFTEECNGLVRINANVKCMESISTRKGTVPDQTSPLLADTIILWAKNMASITLKALMPVTCPISKLARMAGDR